MKLAFASISPSRKGIKSGPAEELIRDFVERAGRLVFVETVHYASEAALFHAATRHAGRTAAQLVLFDARGETVSSEEFAANLGRLRDAGAQQIWFCTGPADGWSAAALARAQRVVSLGRMTLPHELARVLVAEQVYRALTILAGHPYHLGH